MKNMYVWPYFASKDIVWFSDLYVGGLYTYDCENDKICCKIKPDELFNQGVISVEAIVCWGSFVFVFSDRLDGSHIVYDALKDKIENIAVLEDGGQGAVHQAVIQGSKLYLIPMRIRDYIYEVNLSVWKEKGGKVRFVKRRIGKNVTIRTWLPKSGGEFLYIPEYGGKRVFAVSDDEIKVMELDISYGLNTVGIYEKELWAVPSFGEWIYCLTLDGKVKEKVKISGGCEEGEGSDIWEIVVKDEFIIFVHWKKPEINIYNRKSRKMIEIDCTTFERPPIGGTGDELYYYLPWAVWKNKIRFFPFRCNLLEVSLSDMSYQSKQFDFPEDVSEEEWNRWRRSVRRFRYNQKGLLHERNGENLSTFLEYVSEEDFLKNGCDKRNNIGEKIYKYIIEKL